jgi:ankyrin repeat protein
MSLFQENLSKWLVLVLFIAIALGSMWVVSRRNKKLALDREMIAAAYAGNFVAVRRLIREGAEVNDCSDGGPSVLFFAVKTNDIALTKELLDAAANPNLPNCTPTPLGQAVYLDNVDMVKLLLLYGANPNLPDGLNGLVLDSARKSTDPELVKILIEHGALSVEDANTTTHR